MSPVPKSMHLHCRDVRRVRSRHAQIYICVYQGIVFFQAELDLAVSMWNNHTIRPSRNANAPSGQPRRMFDHPSLFNTRDYLCPVSREDINACRDQVEFRTSICCNANVYDVFIDIMAENSLLPPITADEAVVLYRRLRTSIDADL